MFSCKEQRLRQCSFFTCMSHEHKGSARDFTSKSIRYTPNLRCVLLVLLSLYCLEINSNRDNNGLVSCDNGAGVKVTRAAAVRVPLRRWTAHWTVQVFSCARCGVPVLVAHAQSLRQRPDVVVGKAQSFYLSEFGVFGQRGQDAPERVQCRVQVVHPVALSVVGLRPAPASLRKRVTALLLRLTFREVLGFPAAGWEQAAERDCTTGCTHVDALNFGRHPVQ